jgi:CRP/FNR family transcriptional regulator, cyclic AMP receptor protein
MPAAELRPPQRRILASGHWFAGLPAPFQQALCTNARVVTLRAGELLFQRGDANDGLYAMLDGAIRFGAVNPEGKEALVGLAEPPQWFGEVGLLDGGRRTHHAWADSDATIVHVSLASICHWLAEHPEHWQYIGQLAVHKLRVVFAAIEDASLRPPRERLIRCLVLLARGYGERDPSPQPTLRVSQERLGSILALSRQTINALLQGLEREQLLVCMRGGVRILDFGRLLELDASI